MAKHEALPTSADILARMRDHFTYLYTSDRYNGQYADEFCVLESQSVDKFFLYFGNFVKIVRNYLYKASLFT